MADTGDLKSPSLKECGFDSRPRHVVFALLFSPQLTQFTLLTILILFNILITSMPKKNTSTATEAPKSQEPTSQPATVSQPKKLTKSENGKVICGVCAGLGEYFDIDPVIIRLIFLILLASGGSGVLIYVVLCFILPEKGSELKTTKEVIEENAKDIEKTAKVFAANAESITKTRNTQLWIGIFVILLGTILFLSNLGFWDFGTAFKVIVKTLWPLFVIGLGVLILIKNQDEK